MDDSVYIKNLIEEFAQKIGADLTWKGFEKMGEELSLDAKHLKYALYNGKSRSKPRTANLDIIAKASGYKGYRDFIEKKKSNPILESMIGRYYSYVRMNKEKGIILRSPVEISLNHGHLHYYQKGGRSIFSGEVTMVDGCLFVLMRSAGGKSFYHVYRIGKRSSPDVLQGIFSGVNTDFEPIGGRAILWRENKPFASLKTGKLDIAQMRKSKQKGQQLLAAYFERHESNNLSIKSAYTFGPEDLE